jgi:hypothetical protein
MAKKYWSCRKCGTRVERIKRVCPNGCGTKRPGPRVPVHARTLRDDSYVTYCAVNEQIHGISDESCGVCGKPRSQDYKHDRDHGHLKGSLTYGKPRGLACGGNRGCNILMLPWVTAAAARGIAEAKRAAGEPDAERWALIAAYLERVDAHYAEERDAA